MMHKFRISPIEEDEFEAFVVEAKDCKDAKAEADKVVDTNYWVEPVE